MENDIKQNLICTLCPNGCRVTIGKKENGDYEITGNLCKRGEGYAINEITSPKRTITTTVKTIYSDQPRLSVKTDVEIELKRIFKYMEEINKVTADKKYKVGDVVAENILGEEVKLIATSRID